MTVKAKCSSLALVSLILTIQIATVSCTRHRVQTRLAGNVSKFITVTGLKRSYHLYIPNTDHDETSAPLVIALHGGGGTGKKVDKLFRLNALADKYGFIVAYPDAFDHHWNDGRGVKKYQSQRENTDDVAFISTVIDAIAEDFNIDEKRVYVMGASNGAMMALRLGCELTPRITAIAPVIGSMPVNLASRCAPSNPLPLIMINGTDDPLVPFEGGYVHVFRKKLGKVLSVRQTIDFWVARNGCEPKPRIHMEPDTDPEDGTRVQKSVYSQCTDDAEIVLYTIKGGGHTWPGGYQYLPEFLIGKTSRDFNASETIWDFFNGHRR
jgi:polyhydroxybutyrate depolymerase